MTDDPMTLLDRQIAAGWGNTPPTKIPADWQTNPGPDYQSAWARRMRGLKSLPDRRGRGRTWPMRRDRYMREVGLR